MSTKGNDWRDLAATSHYQTAVAVADELRKGQVNSAMTGLEELIDALARSEKRALKSQLVRLMVHIIKWLTQPDQRSRSWAATIHQAREEIADIQEDTPSLTRAVIEEMWAKCLLAAKRQAQAEMDQPAAVTALTWDQVFTVPYDEGEADGETAGPNGEQPQNDH
jgi:hypothetical protein